MNGSQPATQSETEVLVQIDSESFGLYTFPLDEVEVAPEYVTDLERSVQLLRGASLADSGALRLDDHVFPPRSHFRTHPNVGAGYPATSWGELAPSAAPIVLLSALPVFWLNRFRRSSKFSVLALPGKHTVDLGKLLHEQRELRERLMRHRASLGSKFFSLGFHRSAFRRAVKEGKRVGANRRYFSIEATAEFSAHDNCAYSILDELASVVHILERIRTGKHITRSFHDLHKQRASLASNLRAILDSASWYEPFRLRRATSAHGFGSQVFLDESDNDFRLYQHPDKLIRGTDDLMPRLEVAERIFDDLVHQFDAFAQTLAIHLLSWFHPADFVVLHQAEPGAARVDVKAVWVRNISFNPELEQPGTGWALGGADQIIRVRMDASGELADMASVASS